MERYYQLPPTTKAFLETLTESRVANFEEVARLAQSLTPQAKDFLLNAKPSTLEWLRDARKDEIQELRRDIELARSARTVGKLVRWGILIVLGAFITTVQFGESLQKFTAWWRLGGK